LLPSRKIASEDDEKYYFRSSEFSMRKIYGDLNWRGFLKFFSWFSLSDPLFCTLLNCF